MRSLRKRGLQAKSGRAWPVGYARHDLDRRPVSLRKIAAALAERGYVASTGKPYAAAAVAFDLNHVTMRFCNRTVGFFRCSAMKATGRSLCPSVCSLAAITKDTQQHQEQREAFDPRRCAGLGSTNLPEQHRRKPTWRHVSTEIAKAAEGKTC